eukprot:Clim_evm20s191 gene=Clim_evmTU20s191
MARGPSSLDEGTRLLKALTGLISRSAQLSSQTGSRRVELFIQFTQNDLARRFAQQGSQSRAPDQNQAENVAQHSDAVSDKMLQTRSATPYKTRTDQARGDEQPQQASSTQSTGRQGSRGDEQVLDVAAREVAVPSGRLSRAWGFAKLGAQIMRDRLSGTLFTVSSSGPDSQTGADSGTVETQAAEDGKAVSPQTQNLSPESMTSIVSTLCRMRGAALKIGQMLSIQDEAIISPELARVMERVRHSADYMPPAQMLQMIVSQLGDEWESHFANFNTRPLAAASIGQVHRGELLDGTAVAMKVQYPGVAESIHSDINNLMSLMRLSGLLPKGMYLENTIKAAKTELSYETDYRNEAQSMQTYGHLIKRDGVQGFQVPEVISALSAAKVFTTSYARGVPLDRLEKLDQTTRNCIAERMLRLTMYEIFVWRYMQTDPNWSNFLYERDSGNLNLLDFGATHSYGEEFISTYYDIIDAAVKQNPEKILDASVHIGFLNGLENDIMKGAHRDAILILGEPFRTSGKYDFGTQDISKRVAGLIPLMLKHRLQPPPIEIYSMHRKLAGTFLTCTKLRGQVDCSTIFEEISTKLNQPPQLQIAQAVPLS